MSTQIQMPAIGWRMAFAPCAECRSIVEQESKGSIYPGQQCRCYACDNILTVQSTVREGMSMTDDLSAFVTDAELKVSKEWDLVEIAFHNDRFTFGSIDKWMASYGQAGFKASRREMEWSIFAKESNPEASVLVLLDDGVVGRCLLVSQP